VAGKPANAEFRGWYRRWGVLVGIEDVGRVSGSDESEESGERRGRRGEDEMKADKG
jgi:hypothetical protein